MCNLAWRQSATCLSVSVWLLQMRIDHKNGTVHFGKLQLESDRLRDNIAVLARRLAHAITIIDPVPSTDKEEAKKKVPDCAYPLGSPIPVSTTCHPIIDPVP